MAVETHHIELETRGHADVVDITSRVATLLRDSDLQSGIACVFVPGATGGLTTVEYEPGCVADLKRLFDRLAPPNDTYMHERHAGDDNGHSHVRAALLGPSLSVPFDASRLMLGTWQQIVFVDFDDRARSRRLVLQLVGE